MPNSAWALALLVACTEDGTSSSSPTETSSDPAVSPPPGTTPPVSTTPPPETVADVLSASCALTDNALRVSCDVTLSAPAAAALELAAPGAAARTFVVEADALETSILGWGLLPETVYTWSIGGFVGEVTTGALPQTLIDADIAVTGAAWGFDAVLYPLRCPGADYFTMIDGSGRIVWYEANEVYFNGSMTGYDWNQPTHTVLSANIRRFQEQHVSGEILLDLERGVDFDGDLHHDVDRWGDLRYLLYEYPVGSLFVDGVHIFDGEKLLATFVLADHYTIPSMGSGDWSHGNALKVTDDGEVVLSIHSFSSVLAFDGDPSSPTFLDVTWVANGLPAGLPDPDYVAAAGATEGFDSQHNTSRVGDELWLFDNKSQATSRALRLKMDDGAGTVAVTGSWSFDQVCNNQGGSIPLDGGGVLASCANSGQVWAFAEGATTPDWTLQASCGEAGGFGTLPILRGIPVSIP